MTKPNVQFETKLRETIPSATCSKERPLRTFSWSLVSGGSISLLHFYIAGYNQTQASSWSNLSWGCDLHTKGIDQAMTSRRPIVWTFDPTTRVQLLSHSARNCFIICDKAGSVGCGRGF